MIHIMARTRQGYRALLIEDGRWFTGTSRLALYRLLARIFARLIPRLLRVMRPGYDPREVPDPSWVREWWRLHRESGDKLGDLDTGKLASPIPIPRTA